MWSYDDNFESWRGVDWGSLCGVLGVNQKVRDYPKLHLQQMDKENQKLVVWRPDAGKSFFEKVKLNFNIF